MNRLNLILFTLCLQHGIVSAQYVEKNDTLPVIEDQSIQFNHPKKIKRCRNSAWIISGSFIATGAVLAAVKNADEMIVNNYKVWEERNEHFKNFSNKADNYLQYAPLVTTFAFSSLGLKGQNNMPNQIALFVKSELLMLCIVMPTKIIVGEPRPDTGARNSFPSGHTAQAFTVATFLSKEYGYRSVWFKIGAYSMATAVGTMRILNDRHWLSDVLAGAGIGILSTNLVYATHKYKWGKKGKNMLTFAPTYNNQNAGMYFSYKF